MPSDERGLTLVEILIALVVISVGLVGIAIVVPVSSEAIQQGGQLSRATFLAEQTIEQARLATWTSAPAVDCLGVSGGDAPPAPTGAGCHGTTASRFLDEVTDAALRLVTVVVTYRTPGVAGQATSDKAVTLEWLVTQR